MGSMAETLLLKARRALAQHLDLAVKPRVFHVEVQRREHYEDADEKHRGDANHVTIVFRGSFPDQDIARKEEPEDIRAAALLLALLLLPGLLFGLFPLPVGTNFLVGFAALHAQHFAPGAAGELFLPLPACKKRYEDALPKFDAVISRSSPGRGLLEMSPILKSI